LLCAGFVAGLGRSLLALAEPKQNPANTAFDGEEFRLPLDGSAAAEIDRLIAMLGSPRFVEREEASIQLWEIGIPAFAKLREAYQATQDFEVRSRIEAIVREVFMDSLVSFGFLGIQQNTQFTPGPENDARIPRGHVGIMLQNVFPDTGAARAGLQRGDIVLAVDGQLFSADGVRAVDEFGTRIRERGPRGRLRLRVLRGNRDFEVVATLTRPKGLVVRQGMLGRVNIADVLYKAEWQFNVWWAKHFQTSEEAAPQ